MEKFLQKTKRKILSKLLQYNTFDIHLMINVYQERIFSFFKRKMYTNFVFKGEKIQKIGACRSSLNG